MDVASLYLAENILLRIGSNFQIKCLDDINAKYFIHLFNVICLPLIDDSSIKIALNPNQAYGIEAIRSILEIVGSDFLDFDLLDQCPAELICAKDPNAVHFLLKIFDQLQQCLSMKGNSQRGMENFASSSFSSSSIFNTVTNRIAPRHLRAKLEKCGKKSVLFSPKTTLHCKQHTSLAKSRLNKMENEQIKKEQQNRLLKNLGVDTTTVNLISLQNKIQQCKTDQLLSLLQNEHQKSIHEVENRIKKVAMRRSINKNIEKCLKEKNAHILLKRAKLTYQNALKNKRLKSDDDHFFENNGSVKDLQEKNQSSIDSNEHLYSLFVKANEEAKQYIKEMTKDQATKLTDWADSIETVSLDDKLS